MPIDQELLPILIIGLFLSLMRAYEKITLIDFYISDVDLNKSYTVALFGFNQIAVIDPETPPECLKAYSPEILNNALQQLATDRQEITRDERQLVKNAS